MRSCQRLGELVPKAGWPRLAAAFLAAATAGCGGAGDDLPRRPMSGKVTLDGRPLQDAAISLIPLGEGPSTGGTILMGDYAIPAAEGPIPGRYRVEIRAPKATGRRVVDRDGLPGATIEETVDLIPARYNLRSQLTAEVGPGRDGVVADFDLKSSSSDAAPRRKP